MTEIIVSRATPPIDWTGVPASFRGTVSAVVRSIEDAENLVHFFGDVNFCPMQPIALDIPVQGWTFIVGAGYAPAGELRDLCVTTWHRAAERIAENNGEMFDFDNLREDLGLIPREKREQAMSEAFTERIRKHRQNPRTDPARQFDYGESDRMIFDMGARNDD